jgi:hypothetical protein
MGLEEKFILEEQIIYDWTTARTITAVAATIGPIMKQKYFEVNPFTGSS